MSCNLYSVCAAFRNAGYEFGAKGDVCWMLLDDEKDFFGYWSDNAYKMEFQFKGSQPISQSNTKNFSAVAMRVKTLQTWHEIFGHQSKRHVEEMLKRNGITYDAERDPTPYQTCIKSKMKRRSFGDRIKKITTCGKQVSSDVCG